jgi:tetratricopeptide (TPR) repeat protein
VRRFARALVPWLAVLGSAGCMRSASAPAGPLAGAWPVARERADSLYASGAWTAAADVVTRAADYVRAPYAADWQLRERRLAAQDAVRDTRRPPRERDELVAAAREYREALRASHSDSLAEGERLARASYATRERLLGPGALATAHSALALADLAFRLSRVAEADSLAESAERAIVAAVGENHPDVAIARGLRGRCLKNYTGRSARPRVLELYESALRIRVATLGASAPEIAASWHELGNLERMSGHTASAIGCFRLALAERRRTLGPVHDEVAATLSAMAILEASRSHWLAAESLAVGALAASPPAPVTPPMSRAFRLGVLGQVLRHNGHAREALLYLREAIALTETAWSLSPRDEGSTVQSGLGLHADLAMTLATLHEPEAALEALESGTSRTLLERLHAEVPGTPSERLRRIQRAIPADVALVAWVRSRFAQLGAEEPAWACVVRSEGPPQWIELEHTERRLAPSLTVRTAYWSELRFASRWPLRLPADARELRLASEMGASWFAPLVPWLGGVRQIVVFSPELCAGGPLGALAGADGGWLLDRYAISYAGSATLYALAREHRRSWPRDAAALVVGDPAYPDGSGRRWARLAGSRDEIAAVNAAVPGARVLSGAAANAHALELLARTGELARFRLVHLATHTDVDLVHILESRLVLAPDHGGLEDSRLSAREIADTWRLDADLVCLTGCRSASGVGAAGQGWLGFQQAFLRAGARSVLVSLWPVDDAAAALLVKEFYGRLVQGGTMGSRSQALQGAQHAVREWRNAAGERPFAHPAYWAGFALIGDPG